MWPRMWIVPVVVLLLLAWMAKPSLWAQGLSSSETVIPLPWPKAIHPKSRLLSTQMAGRSIVFTFQDPAGGIRVLMLPEVPTTGERNVPYTILTLNPTQ